MKFNSSKFIYCLFTFLSFALLKAQEIKLVPENGLDPLPYGEEFAYLDTLVTGKWWENIPEPKQAENNKERTFPAFKIKVPREEVIAFALYSRDNNGNPQKPADTKLTAQFFPLLPGEELAATLELKIDGKWQSIAQAPIQYPGWSAHFRIPATIWDGTNDVNYRLLHGNVAAFQGQAGFQGTLRKEPKNKEEIIVASLSCNSSRTSGPRDTIVKNLIQINPDLLFFAGDQTYHHKELTYGWLEFGLQFREVMRDRPTITILDDHDVGQGNIWGAGGIKAKVSNEGGYIYPPEYINMVQRQMTWHLPDPVDPEPVAQDIGVYWTRLRLAGIDFAILEDRKFKSGPKGLLPEEVAPRPDHMAKPNYDPKDLDKESLKLLGERQLKFLNEWSQDYQGAEMKVVLSQTPFAGAAHLHGANQERLYADLDSNGWPQTGRNRALTEIRRAWAPHLCGDQHLATLLQHGIEADEDGPYSFASPAIVNTVYGRSWKPVSEQAGENPVENSPLEWTGNYRDGFDNRLRMIAYANFIDKQDQLSRGDGFSIVRFNKANRKITFECWPRFTDLSQGDKAQYPGWPVTISQQDNDGRKKSHWLPPLLLSKENMVIQVREKQTKEILYTVRIQGDKFQPAVYAAGTYEVLIDENSALESAKNQSNILEFEAKENQAQELVTVSWES